MDGAYCFKSETHLSRLIDETSHITHALKPKDHRFAVASLLRLALPSLNVTLVDGVAANENGYAKHMIHADPAGRFSVLAIKWLPGANTPIHGHNAWGCVGVVDGEIGCETFAVMSHTDQPCIAEAPQLTSTGKLLAGIGTVASVDPDPCGIHRLFNPTNAPATTLHIYGMDLDKRPNGLNKWY